MDDEALDSADPWMLVIPPGSQMWGVLAQLASLSFDEAEARLTLLLEFMARVAYGPADSDVCIVRDSDESRYISSCVDGDNAAAFYYVVREGENLINLTSAIFYDGHDSPPPGYRQRFHALGIRMHARFPTIVALPTSGDWIEARLITATRLRRILDDLHGYDGEEPVPDRHVTVEIVAPRAFGHTDTRAKTDNIVDVDRCGSALRELIVVTARKMMDAIATELKTEVRAGAPVVANRAFAPLDHAGYVKNMITGAAGRNHSVVVVSSCAGSIRRLREQLERRREIGMPINAVDPVLRPWPATMRAHPMPINDVFSIDESWPFPVSGPPHVEMFRKLLHALLAGVATPRRKKNDHILHRGVFVWLIVLKRQMSDFGMMDRPGIANTFRVWRDHDADPDDAFPFRWITDGHDIRQASSDRGWQRPIVIPTIKL
jgi:hypothetical protein